MNRPTPLRRLYALWPFFAGGVAAFATLPLGMKESREGHVEVLVAGILALGIIAAALLPWDRLPHAVVSAPLLAAFAVVGLLRDAEGGAPSGYGPLVLLPVFWLALHGSRRALVGSFAAVGGLFVAPVLIDPTDYPSSEWRRALLWIIVTPVVGLTTHNLVIRMRETSLVDALTGLPNRRAWDDRLARALVFRRRTGLPLSVAILDLDGFKAYNDVRGHLAGDELLAHVARVWLAQVRSIDLLARLGGDEFALLLPDAALAEAEVVAKRALTSTPEAPCSVGVAEWNREESAETLLRRADAALYADKARGLKAN